MVLMEFILILSVIVGILLIDIFRQNPEYYRGYRRYQNQPILPLGYGYRPYLAYRTYLYSSSNYPGYVRPVKISIDGGDTFNYGLY